MPVMEFRLSSIAYVVILAFLLSQIPVSSALTEEERLRAAITNPAVTSFRLTSNIVLTRDLPPFTITSGKARTFKVSSSNGLSISGASRYRGFKTVNAIDTSFVNPNFALTFDNVKLLNFYLGEERDLSNIDGAAISAEDISLTILNSVISSCTAVRGDGGAVSVRSYRKKTPFVIKKTTFSGNRAIAGGAIKFQSPGGALTIEDSVFVGNTASGNSNAPNGGALSIGSAGVEDPAPTVKVTRTSFKNNRAAFGGAFYVLFGREQRNKQKPLVFSSCYFENNVATEAESAGALELRQVKGIQLIKTTYKGNFAGGGTTPRDIFVIRFDGNLVTRIKIVSGPVPVVGSNDPTSYVIL